MTWVLGTNTPFGYVVGLSDICVSVDSTQFDCLQKIYPISRFLAAGFAGSVQIGFEIVDELRKWLVPIPEGGAYVPADVASKFPHIAQEIFNASPVERQQYGSNIMLLCVDAMPDGGSAPQA